MTELKLEDGRNLQIEAVSANKLSLFLDSEDAVGLFGKDGNYYRFTFLDVVKVIEVI